MPKSSPQARSDPPLDDYSLNLMLKEYDTLRELYTQAESSAQNIFNFYLTLVSTVLGAVVLLSQIAGIGEGAGVRLQLMVSGLLVFAAAVGSVYLSSLVGRYAHMSRYASGVDAIRRYLIGRIAAPLPPIYESLMTAPRAAGRASKGLMFLFPTGTYQFFIAAMNALLLAVAAFLVLRAGGITGALFGQAFISAVLIFVFSLTIYNVYAQLIVRRLTERLGIRVDTASDFPFLAGRQ